jgi:hypothetical protein
MPSKKIIILLSQNEADKRVAEILRQEFQKRGMSDVWILAEEDTAADRTAGQRAAELLAAVEAHVLSGESSSEEEVYTEEEAEKIKKRLEDLGYL